MSGPLLKKAYSPEDFRTQGHLLIDQLADHLNSQMYDNTMPALHWDTPENEHAYWSEFLKSGDTAQMFAQVLKRTTSVHNTKYIGHQVAPTAPITALSGILSALLNNGMAVYEMGMAPSAMERIVTDKLCKKIGWQDDSRGFLTSGGTLANLTALLAARKAKTDNDVWNKGHSRTLGIMVSEEAHYCIGRAAKIMGLGEKGIIKIPTTQDFQINDDLLYDKFEEARKKGIVIFAIVGSAPVTATGAYDNLKAIGDFSKKHDLWFHVDGAHGGAAIFSEKYRFTVAGIHQADSVVIDGHKMMMMPALTTALLFKNGQHSYTTFSQKADYLLTRSKHEDWYNLAKRTFECTKNMMSLHWYTMFKTYGEEIFEENITHLYDMGRLFADLVKNTPDVELALWPSSNIVCFRYVDKKSNDKELDILNQKIRQRLLEKGEFYIVQTKLRNKHYLRCTIMNPFTEKKDLEELLAKIKEIAQEILAK